MHMIRSVVRPSAHVTAGALVLALALPSIPRAAAQRPVGAASRWLTVNAKAHTATLTLVASYTNALGGFNFNGDGKGKMVISVPAGYRVNVLFSNKGPLPHSVVTTPYAKRANPSGFPVALRGSSSPGDPATGIAGGKAQRFSFVASTVGTYALVCAVPDHAVAGMWDVFKVTRGGTPRLTV